MPAFLPEDCRALLVEPEPLQAITLAWMLEDFRCRRMGPAGSCQEVLSLLAKGRPSFALVDANFAELVPVTDALARYAVPFALLAIGDPANDRLDQRPRLRDRPRIARPFHAPTLFMAALALYQENLRQTLATTERHIDEGALRLAKLRRLKRTVEAGQDAGPGDALARETDQLLATMRASRKILARRLDSSVAQVESLAELFSDQEWPP